MPKQNSAKYALHAVLSTSDINQNAHSRIVAIGEIKADSVLYFIIID